MLGPRLAISFGYEVLLYGVESQASFRDECGWRSERTVRAYRIVDKHGRAWETMLFLWFLHAF